MIFLEENLRKDYIYILNIGAEREIILISADLLKDDAEVVFS